MFIRRAAIAAAAIAAPLAFAAPAMADTGMNFGCSPCEAAPAAAPSAAWENFFANAPWEGLFKQSNGNGAWQNGVQAVNGGAWEKAFPPAP